MWVDNTYRSVGKSWIHLGWTLAKDLNDRKMGRSPAVGWWWWWWLLVIHRQPICNSKAWYKLIKRSFIDYCSNGFNPLSESHHQRKQESKHQRIEKFKVIFYYIANIEYKLVKNRVNIIKLQMQWSHYYIEVSLLILFKLYILQHENVQFLFEICLIMINNLYNLGNNKHYPEDLILCYLLTYPRRL